VVLENLEEAGRELQSRVGGKRGRVDRIYSRRDFEEEFRDVLGETKFSGHDFDVLLRFLERDKEVLVYDKDTVKLRAAGEEKMITQEDATISSLKSLITDLEAQTHVLEKRVEALGVQAKEAVEKKNRVSALAALKSKKLAETTLGKRYATLSQLEEVFVKIEQAADQVELVRIMEGSTKVLAGLNKQIGGVERVDDIVEQLREQMGQINEVGDVLAEPGKEGVDESEVDDELEAMERAEKEKQEEAEQKAKEETERREAEETRKKLAELEEVERQAAKDRAAADQKSVEPQKEETRQAEKLNADLNKSMEDLRRTHLEPAQEAA
jgi:charged multivesicular body protein 7